jgi:predicted ribonuclease YlaK
LIIPLRVVEEFDVLKYDRRRQDRAERARRILRQIEACVGHAGAPSELRDGITIEVLIEPAPGYRPTDADEEILEVCRELQQYEGRRVILVTADTALGLRGEAQNVGVVRMPSQYSRARDTETG